MNHGDADAGNVQFVHPICKFHRRLACGGSPQSIHDTLQALLEVAGAPWECAVSCERSREGCDACCDDEQGDAADVGNHRRGAPRAANGLGQASISSKNTVPRVGMASTVETAAAAGALCCPCAPTIRAKPRSPPDDC